MMSPTSRAVVTLALILALAACGGTEKKEKDQRTAAGEILPGSISDAMLPYDTVRSQPPLAPPETAKANPKNSTAPRHGPEANDAAAPAGDAAAAPDEEPDAPPAATE